MSDRSPSEERVLFGLDSIESDRKVEVPLRDLMFLHEVLGEFHSFLHQPDNYPTVAHLERFLGNAERGAYRLLRDAYYDRSTQMLPSDIHERFDDFDGPGTTSFDNVP